MSARHRRTAEAAFHELHEVSSGRRGLRRRTVRGVLVMGMSTAGQALLQVIFLGLLARLVAPREFGLVSGALVAVYLTTVLAESGMGVAIVQRPTLTREHIRVAWTISVTLGVVCWAALFGLAPQISDVLRISGLTPILRVIALVFVINCLTLSDYMLSRRLQFQRLALAELTSYAVGYGALALTLAHLGYGAWAIVWGQIGQAIMRTVLVTCMAPLPVGFSTRRGPMRELLNFGGGYSIGRIALWAATQLDNVVVGRYLGPAALGLYGRAYQLVQMPANLFGQVANEVLFPAMASVQDEQATLRKVLRVSVSLLAALALPVSVVAAVTSKSVVLVLLGRDWLPLRAAFDVIIFGLLFRTSSKLTDSVMKARAAVYRRAWRSIVFALAVLTGALVGQRWGLHGVAIGVLGALALNYGLTNQLCLSLVGMRWRDFLAAHLPAVLLALLAGGVAFGTERLMTLLNASALEQLLTVWAVALVFVVGMLSIAGRIRALSSVAELVGTVRGLLPGNIVRGFTRKLGVVFAVRARQATNGPVVTQVPVERREPRPPSVEAIAVGEARTPPARLLPEAVIVPEPADGADAVIGPGRRQRPGPTEAEERSVGGVG